MGREREGSESRNALIQSWQAYKHQKGTHSSETFANADHNPLNIVLIIYITVRKIRTTLLVPQW